MTLRLHKDKGLNPRLGCCEQCGTEIGVMLLGASDSLYKCSGCGMHSIGGRPPRNVCPKEGCNGRYDFERKIDERERLPMGLCDDCQAKNEEASEAVRQGGVFWRCGDCGSSGAIKKSPFADAVRRTHGIHAPHPCGVEFTKDDCPVCNQEDNDAIEREQGDRSGEAGR